MPNKLVYIFVAAAAFSAVGCGNALDCALNGDNLKGRLTFGSGVAVRTDANLVIQYSTDSFGSNKISGTKTNPQGLLTVPYTFCVASGTYQLRAFEDLNKNGELDSGEPSGRLDGTDTGDASFVSKTITTTSSDANSGSTTTDRVTDADIVIDNP
jgi:hypothetical protein